MIGYIERENSFARPCVAVDISEVKKMDIEKWKIHHKLTWFLREIADES